MFVLTNNKNEIIEISSIYEVDEKHRNIIVDTHNIAYGPREKINAYEITDMPEEINPYKYCYTEEKGFYKNENYKEPIDETTEIAEMQLAIAELYEMIEGGN